MRVLTQPDSVNTYDPAVLGTVRCFAVVCPSSLFGAGQLQFGELIRREIALGEQHT
jgi:hypothetical protein